MVTFFLKSPLLFLIMYIIEVRVTYRVLGAEQLMQVYIHTYYF